MAAGDDVQTLPQFKYRAFLSYAHVDRRITIRLHKALERYRVPKTLQEDRRAGQRLGRFFRDDDELAGARLARALTTALESSQDIIVLCSRAAACSRWVDEEISYFRQARPSGEVFAVIVDSRLEVPVGATLPPALRPDDGEHDKLTTRSATPLALDLRGGGFERGCVRLVAGLLRVDFDVLWLRHRRLQTRRRTAYVALAALVVVLIVLSYRLHREGSDARDEADRARNTATAAVVTATRAQDAEREAQARRLGQRASKRATEPGGGPLALKDALEAADLVNDPATWPSQVALGLSDALGASSKEITIGSPSMPFRSPFFSPSGRFIVGSGGGRLRVFDRARGAFSTDLPYETGEANSETSDSGRPTPKPVVGDDFVLFVNHGQVAKYPLGGGAGISEPLSGSVLDLVLMLDGRGMYAQLHAESVVSVREIGQDRAESTVTTAAPILDAILTRSGRLATLTHDGRLSVHSFAGEVLGEHRFKLAQSASPPGLSDATHDDRRMVASPDGSKLVVMVGNGLDPGLHLFRTEPLRLIGRLYKGGMSSFGGVDCLRVLFSDDARRLVVSHSSTERIGVMQSLDLFLDIESESRKGPRSLEPSSLDAEFDDCDSVSTSPDGRAFAFIRTDAGFIRETDPADKKLHLIRPGKSKVEQIRIAQDRAVAFQAGDVTRVQGPGSSLTTYHSTPRLGPGGESPSVVGLDFVDSGTVLVQGIDGVGALHIDIGARTERLVPTTAGSLFLGAPGTSREVVTRFDEIQVGRSDPESHRRVPWDDGPASQVEFLQESVVVAGNSSVVVLDSESGRTLGAHRYDGVIAAVFLSRDGRALATAEKPFLSAPDVDIRLLSLPDLKPLDSCEGYGQAALCPTCPRIACAGSPGLLVRDYEQNVTIGRVTDVDVWWLAMAPGGKFVAATNVEKRIMVWNDDASKIVARLGDETYELDQPIFDPNGNLLAAADDHGVIRLWRVRDWELVAELQGQYNVTKELAFSPDGAYVARLSAMGHVDVWPVSFDYWIALGCQIARDGEGVGTRDGGMMRCRR